VAGDSFVEAGLGWSVPRSGFSFDGLRQSDVAKLAPQVGLMNGPRVLELVPQQWTTICGSMVCPNDLSDPGRGSGRA
jgi:hypothetical protein